MKNNNMWTVTVVPPLLLSVLTISMVSYGQRTPEQIPIKSIMEIINSTDQLSEFRRLLALEGLHRAFLDRTVTVFAPTNDAMVRFKGRKIENLALNHMTNAVMLERQFEESLVSLVPGSPPLWVTRQRSQLTGKTSTFINQAEIIQADIEAKTPRGDHQILHVIDSVLEPLVPISLSEAHYLVQLDARKLLTKSTLYDLGGYRLRVFNGQVDLNRRTHMFGVPGQHTFFLPVDSSFDVSVQLTGYDYERNLHHRQHEGPRIRKELVDASVVESHIVPHRLLFTNQAPTEEFPTVAWLQDGIKVNVSLQPPSFQGSTDSAILNWKEQHQAEDTFVFNKYQAEDRPNAPENDPRNAEKPVMVRSNTIRGDRVHARGMVVARILKGNIPVRNGVVHLIDKPLMIVARSLYEYVSAEGRVPGNRLSKFARLLRDKGGLFAEALLEAKQGTLLAPSNEALENVDQERLDFILGNDYLRAEMLGLHFVRERIVSTEYKIQAHADQTFSAPASLAANRVWFHFQKRTQKMTVAARGINATVTEKDIGTINGVIHVIDRVLGVPYQTVGHRISTDPNMSHMWSLLKQMRMDVLFDDDRVGGQGGIGAKLTVVVPSNSAWEKAQLDFSKAYNTLLDGQFPHYTKTVLERHIKLAERAFTFEELVERSRSSPRRTVEMLAGALQFTQAGEFALNAYKDNFVAMKDSIRGTVIRPNIECLNGYIHVVDTVMLDDAAPWTVGCGSKHLPAGLVPILVLIFTAFTL